MKVNIRLCILILAIIPAQHTRAQHKWSLDECISYATSHNLNIQERILEVQSKEVNLNTSKNAWLPDLNVQIGEQVGFGNRKVPVDLISKDLPVSNSDVSYASGRIAFSIPVFNGFRIKNSKIADEHYLEAASADLNKAKKDVGIQIAVYYLECLYSKNMAQVARAQVEVSRKLVERATKLVNDGRRPQSELAEAEAQLANDEYLLVEAGGYEKLSLLTLSQILNLDSMDGFDIAEIGVDDVAGLDALGSPESIYSSTADFFPSIVSAREQIEAGKAEIKKARSIFYPSLSLTGYCGAFHLRFMDKNLNQEMINRGIPKTGISEVIGAQLVIPIFNRYATRNKVRLAQLKLNGLELQLDYARKELHKEIQTAYYNAQVAYEKLLAAEKAVEASSISVGYEEKSYDSGRSNIYDLQTAQQKHLKAKENAVQAKYEYLVRQRVLKFYCE